MSHSPYKEYVVHEADIQCTNCLVLKSKILAISNKTKSIQGKFQCVETDKDTAIVPFPICITEGTCKPQLAMWINKRSTMTINGSKALVEDATIQCVYGGGTISFANSGQTPRVPMPTRGHIEIPKEAREGGYILRNPIKACKIGIPMPGANNISNIAVLYATGIDLNENDQKEGSQVNAFRHALWQAMITDEFGADDAAQIGNAHENNPIAHKQADKAQEAQLVYSTLLTSAEADEIIDLRNNEIGRSLNTSEENKTNEELAYDLLEHYKNEGLYVRKDSGVDDYFTIEKEKLSQQQYEKAKSILDDENHPNVPANRRNKRECNEVLILRHYTPDRIENAVDDAIDFVDDTMDLVGDGIDKGKDIIDGAIDKGEDFIDKGIDFFDNFNPLD